MDDRDERQQLDELRALLKRAEKTPAKTAAVRKEALKRLIEVVHSPYTSLKTLAASNFRLFIKDFPELEDDAINAVYDLCEDSVAKVRIDGYYAIISVSKEQKKWVKRNADVLVQLLQSDEPEEVVVVKKALIEHLDMDPVVTLGVLCDQIAPLSQDWDEEDQVTRDRLRSLVLAFLTGEAHRAITERHAHTPGSPAEEVLVTGILKGIPKLPHTDVDLAVKELLLSLSSFSQYSSRGAELLEVVLEAAKSSLKAEVASGVSNPPVPNTSYFLGLASFISVEKRVAKPDILLRFYCTSVVSRVILMRLPEVAKASILSGIADSLIACDEITRSGDFSKEEMTKLRKQVVDTCVVLLPCFASITSSGKRPWKSCRVLLQECSQRKASGWTIPSPLVESLERIQDLTETDLKSAAGGDKASIHEAQSLIRPLLPPRDTSSKRPIDKSPISNTSQDKPNGTPVTIQRNRNGHARASTEQAKPNSLPPKPLSDLNALSSGPRDDRRQSTGGISSQVARQLGTSGTDKPSTSRVGSSKNEGRSEGTPSLLSRLALSSSTPTPDNTSSRSSTPSVPAKRRSEVELTSNRRPTPPVPASRANDMDVDPDQGFRILGAASRSTSAAEPVAAKTSSSLLDRLKGDGPGRAGDRDREREWDRDRRGKKRTRNY